jgi:hypothetical protein
MPDNGEGVSEEFKAAMLAAASRDVAQAHANKALNGPFNSGSFALLLSEFFNNPDASLSALDEAHDEALRTVRDMEI